MKALSIRPPWAQLIAEGLKPIENRLWPTTWRGRLAIHASKRWDRASAANRLVREAFGVRLLDPDAFTYGAVIATCTLVDVHLAKPCCEPWGQNPPGGRMYHWVIEDVRLLAEPVPARGHLSLWDIDLEAVPDG